jgi:excisionase family DNA binding protein
MRKSRSLLLGSSPNSDRLLEDGLHLPRPKAVSASGKIEPQESKLVTVSEAARFLRVQPGTVYKMLSRGGIPGAFRVSSIWRVNLAELQRLLHSNPNLPKPDHRAGD